MSKINKDQKVGNSFATYYQNDKGRLKLTCLEELSEILSDPQNIPNGVPSTKAKEIVLLARGYLNILEKLRDIETRKRHLT